MTDPENMLTERDETSPASSSIEFPSMSLVEHARRELAIVGEEQDVIDWYVKVIESFSEFGHSGFSAEYMTQVLGRLLRYQNLAPLTSAPEEWVDRSEMSDGPLWQSLRSPEYFSNDGGKTFYSVAELEQLSAAKAKIDQRTAARMASARGFAKKQKQKKRRKR